MQQQTLSGEEEWDAIYSHLKADCLWRLWILTQDAWVDMTRKAKKSKLELPFYNPGILFHELLGQSSLSGELNILEKGRLDELAKGGCKLSDPAIKDWCNDILYEVISVSQEKSKKQKRTKYLLEDLVISIDRYCEHTSTAKGNGTGTANG